MLLLYAYGLGLLKAERYDSLFRWFGLRRDSSSAVSRTLVGNLFLDAWRGGNNQYWQNLDGLARAATALSDHLHSIFSVWSNDYSIAPNQFTKSFEMLEILGALAYLTFDSTKESLAEAANDPRRQRFVGCPIGRASWDRDHREPILVALQEEETRIRLLQAGFAKGDDDFLSLAIESVRRCMASYSWR